MSRPRAVLGVFESMPPHMVGDGFPVRTFFPSRQVDQEMDPFLLLDYAAPREFPPSDRPHGVEAHPHRGFETVTIVYQGGVEHRDSAGHSGTIGPGDVQWMTAGSGLLHEEMHEREFARRGGTFEVAQLWVNLPRAAKMTPPHYQTLLSSQIPVVQVQGGQARVIAGELLGKQGPASTFTALTVADVSLSKGGSFEAQLPDGHSACIPVFAGALRVGGASAQAGSVLVLDRAGGSAVLEALDDCKFLLLSGKPLEEPVARYGPFVMNSQQELMDAVRDYQAGKMGYLS